MDVIKRMKNVLIVKADQGEVIQAESDLFTPKPLTGTAIKSMFPVAVSTGNVEGSVGDPTLAQNDPVPANWTWVALDLAGDAPVTKSDLYPYYRATEDSIVTFAALD